MKLRIAEDLSLPIEAVTEKLAFLGRTGSGKTYAAMKLAELMLESGAQIVSLDPVGAWHGLRIGGPWGVYIFGGLRGDYPLEPTGGKLMADLIADRGLSAVLDISQFIRAEQVRFACDFIERFFNRKKAAPSAVHLFLEECQEFAPQNPGNNEAHMLHHFERMWKLGRNFGIGGSIVSQRPQEVNKKVLNQAGTLFVFNMTGPQERKAIADWTRQAGINEDIESVLPTLKTGQPHVWSPTFLQVSKTVKILAKITADVSMTPKVGARTKEQPLTPIDVERLTADMAATVERSKADDPRELRKQIAELKKQLASQEPVEKIVEVAQPPLLNQEDRDLLNRISDLLGGVSSSLASIGQLSAEIGQLDQRLTKKAVVVARPSPPVIRRTEKSGHKITEKIGRPRQAAESNGSLGKAERSMLTVLAQRNGRPVERNQLGILAGYSTKSSHLDNTISSLRTRGLIEGTGEAMRITGDGLHVLGDYEAPPTGQALINWWSGKLGTAERAMFTLLTNKYPARLSREEISELTGYSSASSHLDNCLSRLRTLDLIEGRGDGMKASDTLFE